MKREPEREYAVHLFEHCNLRCSFCWQDTPPKPSIVEVDEIISVTLEALVEDDSETIRVNVMGGELFDPDIYPELRETYLGFVKNVTDLGKKITISWLTNLTYDTLDHLLEFLSVVEKINPMATRLGLSYDSRGRFNRADKRLFMANVGKMVGFIGGVSVVGSRINMEAIIANRDPDFKVLYETGLPIYIDDFMPSKNSDNRPSLALETEFLKFMAENYPKTEPINSLLKNNENRMTCRSTVMVTDKGLHLCGGLHEENNKKELFRIIVSDHDNTAIEEQFLEEKGCLFCEYFSRCTLGCFAAHNAKEIKIGTCPKYDFFKTLGI